MIRKLRKKVILMLMSVVVLFLICILGGLFVGSKTDYERRSNDAFRNPKAPPVTDNPSSADFTGTPVAICTVGSDGSMSVSLNQIYYLTDDELIGVIETLQAQDRSSGMTDEYSLRFRRHTDADGVTRYFLTDTYVERAALNAQLLYSCIIGLGAIGLFFIVSLLLSRWMIRPVATAWEKQRQFIADASHELKTPLTVVLSNADMLIDAQAVTDEKNRRRLDNIKAESQRMKGLVESMLLLARSDSGTEPLNREPVNFSYIVTCSVLTLEPVIFDMGRTVDSDVEEGLTVMGDGAKLRQVADILLDNAGKYSDEGSVIRVALSAAGKKELLLSVSSKGEPLSPQECKAIFERFYRSDQSRGTQKGYGLGLAIAQTIVTQHGGHIWAQSDGEHENAFCVRLPCKE